MAELKGCKPNRSTIVATLPFLKGPKTVHPCGIKKTAMRGDQEAKETKKRNDVPVTV